MNADSLSDDPANDDRGAAVADRLVVVACCYALTPAAMCSRLHALARRCRVSMHGVIVANRAGTVDHGDTEWAVIAGSNRVYDFSAYAEGLAYLRANSVDPACLVFINDSLFQSHHPSANLHALIRQLPLLGKIEAPAIAGKADRYATVCHANPWSGLGLYVSTYCFGLNRPALPILAGLDELVAMDLGEAVPEEGIAAPDWGTGLSVSFREFIRAFLIYGHADFRWPGLGRYVPGDHLLAVKARCICLEHRLSGEIGRLGCILPTNQRRITRLLLDWRERMASWMRRIGWEPS